MARLVFMGSPAFAVPTLDALTQDHDVLAVFAQPDRPAGRGRKVTPVPVKTWAEAHGVPAYQPRSFRKDPSAEATLRALAPDAIVVVAYGLILPQSILDAAPHGCLNVHASLLPRHRGAAPIPAAILAGDTQTGVTIMRMDTGVDTGPILAQAREPIHPEDTSLTLSVRLSELGARLMVETLPAILRGEISPAAQDKVAATLCPKIDKSAGRIDWSRPAIQIDRMIRAYTPWPGAFTYWAGTSLRIVRASANRGAPISQAPGQIGCVIELAQNRIGVVTGEGVLILHDVQIAGRRAMPVDAFVRGQPDLVGSILQSEHEGLASAKS